MTRTRLLYTGVVDQDIQAAKLFDHFRHHGFHVIFFSDIGLQHKLLACTLTARLLCPLSGHLGLRCVAIVINCDVGALLRESDGNSLTDSG